METLWLKSILQTNEKQVHQVKSSMGAVEANTGQCIMSLNGLQKMTKKDVKETSRTRNCKKTLAVRTPSSQASNHGSGAISLEQGATTEPWRACSFSIPTVMVNFLCQRHWAKRCPESWWMDIFDLHISCLCNYAWVVLEVLN